MALILKNFKWKAQIPTSMPIVAIEFEPEVWIFTGGMYRLKQNMDSEKFNSLFGSYNFDMGCHIHRGELSEEQRQWIDFVFPYVWGQTTLDEKYYTEG